MFRATLGCILLSILVCWGCGGGKKKNGNDAAVSGSGGAGGSSSQAGTGGGPGMDGGGETSAAGKCGNKITEDLEECDDGNSDESDGCTSLCAFSCHEDKDCKPDPCNNGEKCDTDKTHTCVPTSGAKPDGTECGDNAWCYQGKCYQLECGNKVVQPGEDCDDGNLDDADGCTKRCKYTCTPGIEGENVNPCDPTATCDGDTHKWIPGDPLPDGAKCDRMRGYCKDGVCVYSVCGDGNKEPNEECDLGDKNGGPDCSVNCTIGECGNGTVEGEEQCDDGNTDNLDGCNFACKVEHTIRGTRMDVSTEDAPSYCYYANAKTNANYDTDKGNTFRNAFPVDANTGASAILDLINSTVNGMMDDGTIQSYFYSMDVDDYSGHTADPIANLGLAMGRPVSDAGWPTDPAQNLDLPVYAWREYFDDKLEPLVTTPGETLTDKGEYSGQDVPIIRSIAPVNAGFNLGGTVYQIQKLMSRIEIDGVFSNEPPPPDNIISSFTAPESVGAWVYPAAGTTTKATGVLCGALHRSSFDRIPLPDEFILGLCTTELLAGKYTGCGSILNKANMKDPSTGDCSSMLDLFVNGCSGLLGQIIVPIGDPPIDSDNDGTGDSYPMVMRVSGRRVKIVGVTDKPDGGLF